MPRTSFDFSLRSKMLWSALDGKFRLWSQDGTPPNIVLTYRESADAINWTAPVTISQGIDRRGISIIDQGVPGSQRFKNLFYWIRYGAGTDGVYPESSPDGINWTTMTSAPIFQPGVVDDIADLVVNPFTGGYWFFAKVYGDPNNTNTRQTWVSHGTPQFSGWTTPVPAFTPDAYDTGVTQFWGVAGGPIMRDGVALMLLRVLRDDVGAMEWRTTPTPAYYPRGIGYSVLAWSRDGIAFNRARVPFMSGRRGTWDEALVWAFGLTEKDATLYITYSGNSDGRANGPKNSGYATMPSADFTINSDGYNP